MDSKMDTLIKIKQRLDYRECEDDWARVSKVMSGWVKNPYPVEDLHRTLLPYLDLDLDLLDELMKTNLPASYPNEYEKARIAQVTRDEEHTQACENQTQSPLLRLAREIRDMIWSEVHYGNIIHVTRSHEHDSKRRYAVKTFARLVRPKYNFHRCVAANGLKSAAIPPGERGDHINCDTSGPSDAPAINVVCKQTYLENLELKYTFYSRSAFQFPDLATAGSFLFHLAEKDRAAIMHLRIAVSDDLMNASYPGRHDSRIADGWQAINNYFSNPWDRRTLRMHPQKKDKPWVIREPIYFYYSDCYYSNNKDRLYDRWQVGRGSISWDVGISDLRYKGVPRLDLAMRYHRDRNKRDHDQSRPVERDPLDTQISEARDPFYWLPGSGESPLGWLVPLLQFRNYDGLDFKIYDEQGVTSTPAFETFAAALKEEMAGSRIGPRISAFFAGRPYEDGSAAYIF